MPAQEIRAGSKETYIFVDGSAGGDQLARLRSLAPAGPCLVTVLLPDHGDDESPGATRRDHERDLADCVNAHGTGKTTVVGYSYGAYLAGRICGRADVHVDRAVLIGGFAGLPEEVVQGREQIADALQRGTLSDADFASTCRSLFVGDPADHELTRVSDEMAQSVSRAKLVRWIRRINEAGHAPARVGPFETPAVVLHDPEDAAVPIAFGEELAARGRNAELVRVESGGHVGMIARPRMIAEHVFGNATTARST